MERWNHNRKLKFLCNDGTSFLPTSPTTSQNSTNSISSTPTNTTSSPPAPPSVSFNSFMALTVLVLLTGLFFFGFFSIYIQRFCDDTTPDLPSQRRPRRPTSDRPSRPTTSRKGLDPEVVKSLPVYLYYPGDAKYQIECAICLGEFEEKESVKMIPFCKHAFHLECIDTWLKLHVACPVCRGTQLFDARDKVANPAFSVVRNRNDHGEYQIDERSTLENRDTYKNIREVVTVGVNRSSSCSGFGERKLLLRRTCSL